MKQQVIKHHKLHLQVTILRLRWLLTIILFYLKFTLRISNLLIITLICINISYTNVHCEHFLSSMKYDMLLTQNSLVHISQKLRVAWSVFNKSASEPETSSLLFHFFFFLLKIWHLHQCKSTDSSVVLYHICSTTPQDLCIITGVPFLNETVL